MMYELIFMLIKKTALGKIYFSKGKMLKRNIFFFYQNRDNF